VLDDEYLSPNELSRRAWEHNAEFWNKRMGEGNDWVEVLEMPAIMRLLDIQPGEGILDIACGNGLTSRRLADLGAQVTAFDFSSNMIAYAQERSREYADRIHYQVIDATDTQALLSLGEGVYDAALCNMALFDMADIQPLLDALPRLLRRGGRFVFTVVHPCFNNNSMTLMTEWQDQDGEAMTRYAVKVWGYITPSTRLGAAIFGQPKPQPYFHRPLQDLLGACFRAGFVLDGLEEPAFPPDHPGGRNPLSWSGKYSEIPPVLAARLRLPKYPRSFRR
jgi:2-polyprenyl-3-methyl-5-hydroxy-6-metoxy-1,4-benzoquinol methylase